MKIGRRTLLKSAAAAAMLSSTRSITAAQAQSGDVVRLGVVVGQTGGYAVYAAELKRGIDLAIDRINAKGLQIGGKRHSIVAKYYDDKTEASTAARLVERAVSNDGNHAVLASGGSAIVKANLSVAQRMRYPMMPLWSQVDGVYAAQKGDPYLFSALPPFSLMYRKIMEMISNFDNPAIKTVAMITPNDELGVYTGREYFPEDLKQTGLQLSGIEYYPPGSQEYTTALGRLRRLEPDCLIINAFANDIIGIVKEMRAINWFPKALVVETSGGLREPLGDVLNGIHVPIIWDASVSETRDEYVGGGKDFSRLYVEKYGKEAPDFVAAIGAHDLITYAQVLSSAGTLDDPKKIKAAFQAYSGQTFFGSVGFSDDGLNRKGTIYPGQFQDQIAKVVYPPAVRAAEPIHPYPRAR